MGLIEQSATRALMTRENGTREIGRARQKGRISKQFCKQQQQQQQHQRFTLAYKVCLP